ncbi:hypothetical protein DITRI_Ditri12bG0015100 [Diplodiscus trichospermus]
MAEGKVTCHLVFLLIAAWISITKASQGGIADSNHKISTGKGLLNDGERAGTAATSKNWLGGRKMLVGRQMRGAVGRTWKFSSTNIPKCDKNLGCEQTFSHFSDEVDESGFVAFNADYHGPRHHPPKNN